MSPVSVRHQPPSPPSCRRSRFRGCRSRPRRTLSPPATFLVVPTISSTFSSKSAIAKFCNDRQTKMTNVDSNIQHRYVPLKNHCTQLVRWPLDVQMQNLFITIYCVSWKQLYFSCCLVCISMTRAFRCQYALENKVGLPTSGVDIPCRRSIDFWRWR